MLMGIEASLLAAGAAAAAVTIHDFFEGETLLRDVEAKLTGPASAQGVR